MLCQNCHENEATIHVQQIVNGKIQVFHLCEKCAAKKGIEAPDLDDFNLAEMLFDIAGKVVKAEGKPNDLISRLEADPLFAKVAPKMHEILKPSQFVGRAPQQVEDFLREAFEPVRARLAAVYESAKVEDVNV